MEKKLNIPSYKTLYALLITFLALALFFITCEAIACYAYENSGKTLTESQEKFVEGWFTGFHFYKYVKVADENYYKALKEAYSNAKGAELAWFIFGRMGVYLHWIITFLIIAFGAILMTRAIMGKNLFSIIYNTILFAATLVTALIMISWWGIKYDSKQNEEFLLKGAPITLFIFETSIVVVSIIGLIFANTKMNAENKKPVVEN